MDESRPDPLYLRNWTLTLTSRLQVRWADGPPKQCMLSDDEIEAHHSSGIQIIVIGC